jgi:imidazolonepropionase-like amidohydrolase
VSFTFQAGGYTSLLELREAAGRERLTEESAQRRHQLESYFEAKRGIFGRLLRDGMLPRLVISTDAGPGDTEFGHLGHGLELAVEGGMTVVQAVEAVTRVAAEACGVGHLVGTLEPSKEADLLAVNGDLLQDVHAIADVRAVYLAGSPITH